MNRTPKLHPFKFHLKKILCLEKKLIWLLHKNTFLWHTPPLSYILKSICHLKQFLCVCVRYIVMQQWLVYVIFSWHLINPQDILCIFICTYFNAIQLRVVVQLKQIGGKKSLSLCTDNLYLFACVYSWKFSTGTLYEVIIIMLYRHRIQTTSVDDALWWWWQCLKNSRSMDFLWSRSLNFIQSLSCVKRALETFVLCIWLNLVIIYCYHHWLPLCFYHHYCCCYYY